VDLKGLDVSLLYVLELGRLELVVACSRRLGWTERILRTLFDLLFVLLVAFCILLTSECNFHRVS
jgi:hypothetical protein